MLWREIAQRDADEELSDFQTSSTYFSLERHVPHEAHPLNLIISSAQGPFKVRFLLEPSEVTSESGIPDIDMLLT